MKKRDYVGNVMVDTAYIAWEKPYAKYETIVIRVDRKGKPLKHAWEKPLALVTAWTESEALFNHARLIEEYRQ